MPVSPKTEEHADFGHAAAAGIHPTRPEETSSNDGHEDHDHEHGFKLIEVLRVVFVALAAAAVWFHLWEPFHRISVIGLAAALIGGNHLQRGI